MARKNYPLGIDGRKLVAAAALGGASVTVSQGADVSLSQWHHVALTAVPETHLYVDGVESGSARWNSRNWAHVHDRRGRDGRHLTGDIDEVESRQSSSSADWIKTSARSQAWTQLVVYGADGQKEVGGQPPICDHREESHR